MRIKTKLTDAQVRNLERNLDLATSNLKEAKYRVTERRADVLEAQLGKLCLMLELRDAQLRSLRRRMRRGKIYGLFGWGRW